ncbi:BET3 family protein [Mycotypha africana]|uniref:BET3 family protein n=1 Tax=Mycotypha africana TaxID=64632 RepID=UPI00230187EB|nr:BET3 family protein [Mycotypha africana]KAI8987737.1 BET3 family protein [Mycotypha africana]
MSNPTHHNESNIVNTKLINSSLDDSSNPNHFVSETCMDLFLIEMVDTICRTTIAEETDDGNSDAIYYKLESIGYAVGQRLVERFTKDRPRFVDTLDVVKFICKDLWTIMFKKQIDNLKTNHRDNGFRWFMRMSTDIGGADSAKKAMPYVWFPCGLIRGALANLGVPTVVVAETTNLPQCTFQIKIVKQQ